MDMRKIYLRTWTVILTVVLICSGNLYGQFTKITTGDFAKYKGYNKACLVADYDADGFPDILVTSISDRNALFRNMGNGVFTEVTNPVPFPDQAKSGTWGDFNNDGRPDVYLAARTGWSSFPDSWFYINNGNGTFTPYESYDVVHDWGGDPGNPVWADMDNDGRADLYITNSDGSTSGSPNRLYMNNGDLTCTKLSNDPSVLQPGNNYKENATVSDFDIDGDQDIFVTNWGNNKNYYYRNNGDGTFTQVTTGPFVNQFDYFLTSSSGDYDNDGDADLFVGMDGSGHYHLFSNNGNGNFIDEINSAIYQELIGSGESAESSSWIDYDNDGYLDLYIVRAYGSGTGSKNLFFHNNGDETFTKITNMNVATDQEESNGHAWADFNRDGTLDLAVVNQEQYNSLYLNYDTSNNWISFTLDGAVSNRSAIGAKVYLYTPGLMQFREITSQTGRHSQNSMDAHFGLGNNPLVDSVRIVWPSGIITRYADIRINRFIKVTEAITGELDGCVNSTGTYDATIPSTSYTWEATGGLVVGGQNTSSADILWTTGGPSAVTLTTDQGTYSQTVEVSVPLQPSVNGPATVCKNDTATYITAGNPGQTDPVWVISGGVNISGQGMDTIIVVWDTTMSGIVDLHVHDDSLRCDISSSLLVAKNPLPEAMITRIDSTLFASQGENYQWYFNDEPIPEGLGGKESSIQLLGVGTYQVLVTSPEGCSKLSVAYLFTSADSEIAIGPEDIIVFPNPCTAGTTIRFTKPLSGDFGISLLDVSGRIVADHEVILVEGSVYIPMPYDPGLYFLHFNLDGRIIIKKIVLR